MEDGGVSIGIYYMVVRKAPGVLKLATTAAHHSKLAPPLYVNTSYSGGTNQSHIANCFSYTLPSVAYSARTCT